VQCGFNEDDAVEKLLHDSVLALIVRLCNSLQLDLRLSVNRCLDGGRDACTLGLESLELGFLGLLIFSYLSFSLCSSIFELLHPILSGLLDDPGGLFFGFE